MKLTLTTCLQVLAGLALLAGISSPSRTLFAQGAGLERVASPAPEVAAELDHVVHHVLAATITGQTHYASVHQTIITNPPTSTGPTADPNILEEQDYSIVFSAEGAQHALRRAGSNPASANRSTGSPKARRTGFCVFNPISALKAIPQMASVSMTDETEQGRPCYRISAAEGRVRMDLWVSKDQWTVLRQIGTWDGRKVLDVLYEYTEWNGHSVPLRNVITTTSPGMQVIQSYSNHTF